MAAILFGSISTLADTSELQRAAYNEAFRVHGLDWTWEQDEYAALLEKSGGQDRVEQYAVARGQEVDAGAVHATKSEIFQQKVVDGVEPRPGVVDTVEAARRDGVKLALVTTTSRANVTALTQALHAAVDVSAFDLVVSADDVETVKPDPAVYAYALEQLGELGDDCVAVEDNVGGVESATAAGIRCVAFPNENTAQHGFDQAVGTVDRLDYAELRAVNTSA